MAQIKIFFSKISLFKQTNNEMVQNLNSETKKFLILCTFKDDVTVILSIGYFFHGVLPPTDGICQV